MIFRSNRCIVDPDNTRAKRVAVSNTGVGYLSLEQCHERFSTYPSRSQSMIFTRGTTFATGTIDSIF